jgi:hypothetical protein
MATDLVVPAERVARTSRQGGRRQPGEGRLRRKGQRFESPFGIISILIRNQVRTGFI